MFRRVLNLNGCVRVKSNRSALEKGWGRNPGRIEGLHGFSRSGRGDAARCSHPGLANGRCALAALSMAVMSPAPPNATTLQRARDAINMLCEDTFRKQLESLLLETITSALQTGTRGQRPSLPDRWKFLNKLADSNAQKPLHTAAYEAFDWRRRIFPEIF